MLFRNLMAMDVEEMIRAYPFDAVVLIGGCDKTQPAQLMGAASADVPAIMLTGGPSSAALHRGRELGGRHRLLALHRRAPRRARSRWTSTTSSRRRAMPGAGHCNVMGTASTMACVAEALGMALPGTAAIPALDRAPRRASARRPGGGRSRSPATTCGRRRC